MHRSSIVMTIVLALLLTTSGAVLMSSMSSAENDTVEKQWDNFLVSLGTDYDPTGGGTDWTQISSVEDLAGITNDLGGKYYLTNNIDFSTIFTEDNFEIIADITVEDDEVTVSLFIKTLSGSVPMYASGDVILNEQTAYLSDDEEAVVTFEFETVPTEFKLAAGGTVTNIDETFLDKSFSIAAEGSEAEIESKVMQAKGNFTPLGSSEQSFTGILDGCGHIITGLSYYVNQKSENAYAGLFAYTGDGATIKNLGLEGGNNKAYSISWSSSHSTYAGGLIGYANGATTIINSYNTSSISVTTDMGYAYIGGLIGYAASAVTMSNVYNTGPMSVMSMSYDTSSISVGGMIGRTETSVDISNSYNSGAVSSIAFSSSTHSEYLGGVIGMSTRDTNLFYVYNTGSISALSQSVLRAGGLVGYASLSSGSRAMIADCYNIGNVSSASTGSKGGLVGYVNNFGNMSINSSYVLAGTGTGKLIYNEASDQYDTLSGIKTSDDMKDRNSYINWNFNTLWVVDDTEQINNGYPYMGKGMGSIERWENFFVDESEDYDPTNGESDWIPISTPQQLEAMNGSNKYYLANDVDLRHIILPGTFTIELKAEMTGNSIKVSLYQSVTEKLKFNGYISVNDEVMSVSTADTEWTFTVRPGTEEILVTAGGTGSGLPVGANQSIAIATAFPIGEGIYVIELPSRGNFTPVGASGATFKGTLDGNGYVIKGLRAVQYSGVGYYAGLFGYAGAGTVIKNVGLEGGSNVIATTGTSHSHAGGLVGYSSTSIEIQNSYYTGIVSVVSSSEIAYAGGLIGYADRTATVDRSYNKATIFAASERNSSYATAGGLIAFPSNVVTVTNSYNIGSIQSIAKSRANVGGLVGEVNLGGTIRDSYNTGSVTAIISSSSISAETRAGGITGPVSGTFNMYNSYNTGPIFAKAPSPGNTLMGGLLGYKSNSSTTTLSYSYALSQTGLTKLVGSFSPLPTTYDTSKFLSSEEMKASVNYDGWNFTSRWAINGSINSGYPYLIRETSTVVVPPEPGEGNDITAAIYFSGNGSVKAGVNGEEPQSILSSPYYISNEWGSALELIITPSTGHVIWRIIVDGNEETAARNGTTYTIERQSMSGHTIFVSFKPIMYATTIDVSDEDGASTNVSAAAIKAGNGFGFGINIASGYVFTDVTVNTTSIGLDDLSNGVLTISNVNEDKAIVVSVDKIEYQVTVSVTGEGVSLESPSSFAVDHGDDAEIELSMQTGYEVTAVTVNSTSIGTSGVSGDTLTISNIRENKTVVITGGVILCEIDVSVLGDGVYLQSSDSFTVSYGNNAVINLNIYLGYEVSDITVNSTSIGTTGLSESVLTISNVTTDLDVVITGDVIRYQVEVTVDGTGILLESSDDFLVEYGDDAVIELDITEGYEVTTLMINGVAIENYEISNGILEISNVLMDLEVIITGGICVYQVTAEVEGTGITITTTVPLEVDHGDDVELELVIIDEYEIKFVLVNEDEVAIDLVLGVLKVSNITEDSDIIIVAGKAADNVVFAVIDGNGGSVSPDDPVSVAFDGSTVFTITLDEGYEIDEITLTEDARASTALVGDEITVSNVRDDCVVTIIVVSINSHVVTATVDGAGATITSEDVLTIEHGEDASFVLNVAKGYEIKSITSDPNMRIGRNAGNVVTVYEVTEDCDITIVIGKVGYNVTITSVGEGTTSPAGSITTDYGSTVSITFTPELGYRLLDVKVNGFSNPDAVAAGKLTLVVTQNTNVRAIFADSEDDEETVYLTVSAGEGGTTSGSGGYPKGTPVRISATPDEGYKFVEWSDGNTSQERTVVVLEDMEITAYFESSSGGGGSSSIFGCWWCWILILILLIAAVILYYEWKKRM